MQKRHLIVQEAQTRKRLEQELNNLADQWETKRQREIENRLSLLPTPEQRRQQLALEQARHTKNRQQFGGSLGDARKIANWDPYDPNAGAADWFDAEYMFHVADGFDIIIGNPPYINVENLSDAMRRYLLAHYETCVNRTDIYIAFIEKSLSMLNSYGLMCFIVPTAFTMQKYAAKLRQQLIDNHDIRELVDASSYRIFENAVVYNAVISVAKNKSTVPTRIRLHSCNADFENRSGAEFTVDQNFFATLKDVRFNTNPDIAKAVTIKDSVWHKAVRLDQICLVAYGARLNHRTKKIGKSYYIADEHIAGYKPFCEGKNIGRYVFTQAGWLDYEPDEHYNPMFPQLFENKKLMFIRIIKDRLRFAYDDKGFYNSHTVINCVRLDLLTGATHRTAVNALKEADLNLVQQFDYKYLLAVLNSQFINWYFHNFLSDNLNFYPNDAKQLPIPKATATQQHSIICRVDRILKAKASSPVTDTDKDEAEIDRLIYGLYGLMAGDVATVEYGQLHFMETTSSMI